MALPALEASGGADVLVVRGLAPLLELVSVGRVIPFGRGWRGFRDAAGKLRQGGYERGVLLPPSLSSALLFRAGGVRRLRGTPTDSRALLLHDRVPTATTDAVHRAAAYYLLVHGELPSTLPEPRLMVSADLRTRWRELAGDPTETWIGVFPGSNAPSRRWEPARFAEIVSRMAARGFRVAVFGGPGERDLTRAVAGTAGLDLGGRTDLLLLAAGLAACELLVTNDSGPMHLAAAVGTRTVSLWGAGDPQVTGPLGSHNRLVRHTELPCVPCVRNQCPRSGRGYVLDGAERECMRLIGVDEVEAAACAGTAAAIR